MRIGIFGGGGRMGRANIAEVLSDPHTEIAGATEIEGHDTLGTDLGMLVGQPQTGLAMTADPTAILSKAHVIIEFSSPQSSISNARLCAEAGCAHIVGTTGWSQEEWAAMEEVARQIPIVIAGNMSTGVTLLTRLVELAAQALGDDFDIEIVEMHHNQKVDAPSGTALMLGRSAAAGRGVQLDHVEDRARDGMTGKRKKGAIGFAALRGGDVIGDHTVILAGPGERIELSHKAGSREIYAKGAVRAAKWAASQKPGLYSMYDVLGLPSPS